MRVRAVVFDLFGTLVPEFPLPEWDAMFRAMAVALDADPVDFRREWDQTVVERQTGVFRDIEENVRAICRRLGVVPTEDAVARALEIRAELYGRRFQPQPGAVETLSWLRDHGFRTALVSQCTPDTPALWHASPMADLIEVLVFSSEVGLRKPDPAIYLAATEPLGVDPTACLYVGDGSYRELSGAAAVGMTPVRIVDRSEPDAVLRPDRDDWEGTTIDSLNEVIALLEGAGA